MRLDAGTMKANVILAPASMRYLDQAADVVFLPCIPKWLLVRAWAPAIEGKIDDHLLMLTVTPPE
jgi:hypothetical protein